MKKLIYDIESLNNFPQIEKVIAKYFWIKGTICILPKDPYTR